MKAPECTSKVTMTTWKKLNYFDVEKGLGRLFPSKNVKAVPYFIFK